MTTLAAVSGETVPDRVVEVGRELARQFEEELVVLHVMAQRVFEEYRDTDDGVLRGLSLAPNITYRSRSTEESTADSRYTIEDGQRDAESVARTVVDETLDEWHEMTPVGRVGDPAEEILNEASRIDPHFLVVAGRKRTPVGKVVFGSVTQSVLLSADCPVVTVKKGDGES